MKIILLGTNGWFDNEAGDTICILIDASDKYIVLDAGNGLRKFDRYACEDKPAYMFLSHFHLDHINGLHTLMRLNFPYGLKIFGPDARENIKNIFRQPYTMPLKDLPFLIEIFDLTEKTKIPFIEDVLPLFHSSPCFGYRFNIDGKIIAFCTDTGLCDNLVKLGKNADLFIIECAELSGKKNESWPHLTPEDSLYIEKETGAKKIVMVHFDADLYPTIESRQNIQASLSKASKNIIVGFDNMEIEL